MNEMYAAEQITIPSELGTVLKLLTKAAIRDKPSESNVCKWAANFFADQCNRPAVFDDQGKLTKEGRAAAPPSGAFVSGTQQARVNRQYQQQQQQTPSHQQQQQQQAPAQQQQQPPQHGNEQEGEDDQEEQKIVDALFDKYDQQRQNLIPHNRLANLILDLKNALGLAFTREQMEQFVQEMPADDAGMVDLEEFRVAFFQG